MECSGSKVEKSSNGGFVHPVPQTNLGKGDVILVHDPGPLDEKYTVAEVKEENLSKDGFVWSCTVKYRFSYPQDVIRRLARGKVMTLKSSVNRLILLLLLEVQGKTLPVRKGQLLSMIMLNVSTLDNVMIVVK